MAKSDDVPKTDPSEIEALIRVLAAMEILLANSKSRNFNGFQSVYPGGTKIGVFFTTNQG
jgi:hypothetical protein